MKDQTVIKNGSVQNNRIIWVDIAKALAILLMIIGHELPQDKLRVIIFSFHMPLFFILSGYTARPVKNWNRVETTFKKMFWRVWLLASLMVICYGVELFIFQHIPFKQIIKLTLISILKGSNGGNSFTGVMWFLYVYFWARLLYDCLQVLIKPRYLGWLMGVLAILAMLLSRIIWLPQALDIAPVAAFFMWSGGVWRTLEKISHKSIFTTYWVLGACFVFWTVLVTMNVYIELSTRHYPLNIISVFEAIAGTMIFSWFSFWIGQLIRQNSFFIGIMSYLGQQTLTILCIHSLDLYWVIWQSYCPNAWMAISLRLFVDMVALLCFFIVQRQRVKWSGRVS